MDFFKDAALRMAVELMGRAITPETVAKFKYWVEMQAKNYVGRTPTEMDDSIMEVLASVWTPELEKVAFTFVLSAMADFAKTTDSNIDNKIIHLFAKASGVQLPA